MCDDGMRKVGPVERRFERNNGVPLLQALRKLHKHVAVIYPMLTFRRFLRRNIWL